MIEFNVDEHINCDCSISDVVGNLVDEALRCKVGPEYVMDTLRSKLEETIAYHEGMAARAKEIRLSICRQGDPTNVFPPGANDYVDFGSPFFPSPLGTDFYKPSAGQDTISL